MVTSCAHYSDAVAESEENRSTALPILIAAALVGVVLLVTIGLRSCRGEEVSAEAGVGRAVIGQNDALQRGDYGGFRRFTCRAQQGTEAQVLGEQRQSAETKGARYVDDVRAFAVDGDRATATVVYHFEKTADNKITAETTFVREDGQWTVCSPGPR
jgi:hypothetical protein